MFFDFVRHKDTPPTTPHLPPLLLSLSFYPAAATPWATARTKGLPNESERFLIYVFKYLFVTHSPSSLLPLLLYFYRTSIYLAIYLSVCLSVSLCFLLPLCLPNYKMLSILIRQTWQATLCVAFIKNASVVFLSLPPSLSASLSAVLLLKTGLLLRCLGICRLMGLPFAACPALPCLPP